MAATVGRNLQKTHISRSRILNQVTLKNPGGTPVNYNPGQNKMEQQTPLPPPQIKDESAQRVASPASVFRGDRISSLP